MEGKGSNEYNDGEQGAGQSPLDAIDPVIRRTLRESLFAKIRQLIAEGALTLETTRAAIYNYGVEMASLLPPTATTVEEDELVVALVDELMCALDLAENENPPPLPPENILS